MFQHHTWDFLFGDVVYHLESSVTRLAPWSSSELPSEQFIISRDLLSFFVDAVTLELEGQGVEGGKIGGRNGLERSVSAVDGLGLAAGFFFAGFGVLRTFLLTTLCLVGAIAGPYKRNPHAHELLTQQKLYIKYV